jgi:thiamine kinase-like enzyme
MESMVRAMTAGELRDQVQRQLAGERSLWALGDGEITVEPVLNWGGFMKSSFHVTAPARRLHVKLAMEHDQAELRRWMAVSDVLTAEYRAPRALGWIDLPESAGAEHGGIVFEHIEAEHWDVRQRPELMRELAALLERLHADHGLAERINDPERSYRECWEMRYREQFEEDLRTVRAQRPPFVSEASLAWMEAESRRLLAMGREHPALERRTRAPCHWDLWTNNVLVGAEGDWWVLDWDGLAVGDEAEDLATLVWPSVFELNQRPEISTK